MQLEIILGIIMLISYVAFAYIVAKGISYLFSALLIAVLWSVLAYIGGAVTFQGILTDVMQSAPTSFGAALVTIIFGSWFGRVLIETGIAANLIKKTVELGGDKATLTTVLLCIVTAAIFTGAQGTGLYLAIALIVLPIMFALGVPKTLANACYMMSIAAGLFINRVQHAATTTSTNASLTDITLTIDSTMNLYFTICAAIFLVVICVMVVVGMRKADKVKANWAAAATSSLDSVPHVPAIALIIPVVPVLIMILFKWPVIPTLLLIGLIAFAICGKIKSFTGFASLLTQTFADAVADIQNVVGFLFFSMMYNRIAGICAPFLSAVVGDIIPTSAIGLVIMFALCAPLGLFRGPFSVFGSGAVLIALLHQVGVPVTISFPLIYVPTLIMNHGMCPSQSNVIWGIAYAKTSVSAHLKQTFVWGWLACILCTIVAYFIIF